MIETLADIARELKYRYSQAKRNNLKIGEENNIFVSILEDLFDEYGKNFGYDISEFKSIVVKCKNTFKRKRKIVVNTNNHIKKDFWKRIEREPNFPPGEGDGQIFTDYQIKDLDLNLDSY